MTSGRFSGLKPEAIRSRLQGVERRLHRAVETPQRARTDIIAFGLKNHQRERQTILAFHLAFYTDLMAYGPF